MQEQQRILSLKELCQKLYISEATGRNWLRLGRIVPTGEDMGRPCFSEHYAQQLLEGLKNGDTKALRRRRNKTYADGCSLYASYLPDSSRNLPAITDLVKRLDGRLLDEMQLRQILGECALSLLAQALGKTCGITEGFLWRYCGGELDVGEYTGLIEELLAGSHGSLSPVPQDCLSGISFQLEPGQDVLGMLYLSLRKMRGRKAGGAYYTPEPVAKRLVEGVFSTEGIQGAAFRKVLDPCCGTGNFLLRLLDICPVEMLYGGDVDPLAVQLARINLALARRDAPVSLIRHHIQVRDFLAEGWEGVYDVILGNPPWGSVRKVVRPCFSEKFVSRKGAEAYDLFLEQSIRQVKKGGLVSFVLPEAVLHVKSHQGIRSLMAGQVQIQRLSYLGNVFHKVQCPAVILQMQKTGVPMDTCGMKVWEGKREFQIRVSRPVRPECFAFHVTDQEYDLVSRMEQGGQVEYLKDQAEFAMGIVTGNNGKYLEGAKTSGNEIVLKGSDIRKYGIRPASQYVVYQPGQFQQAAPESCYRAKEKLLYRFIGKELVFAYDDRQRLSLNSCNILIPHIKGMDMKYILAVLNSRAAQFLYDRKFRSMKVLRSYLEQIPIPVAAPFRQQEIVLLAVQLLSGAKPEDWKGYYEEADKKIASLYGFTEQEYRHFLKR